MHNHTQDVTRTSQHSIGPYRVLERQAFFVLLSGIADVLAHEFVDLVVGRVRENVIAIIMDQKLIFLSLSEWNSFPELPVSFSIQLVCFYEDAATSLCCLEKYEVSGHTLTLYDLDNLANFDIFGCNGHNAAHAAALGRSLQNGILSIVQLLVPPKSVEVVHSFFDHSDD